MVTMELPKDPEGRVTHLALTRSLRGLSHKALGQMIGVRAEDVLAWETSGISIPRAKAKRAGLAMRWPWEALTLESMSYDDAYSQLIQARRSSAEVKPPKVTSAGGS